MRKIFLFVITLLVSIALAGCGTDENQNSSNNQDLEKEKGIVASIREPKEPDKDDAYATYYYMLVISDMDDVDISGKTQEDLESLARENGGAYYNVHPDLYEEVELDTGTEINVYWNGSEGESNPPVRDAEKIEVVSE